MEHCLNTQIHRKVIKPQHIVSEGLVMYRLTQHVVFQLSLYY